jgi:hypothetical protein
MRKISFLLPCLLFLTGIGGAQAAGELVLGDSLGVGVKAASGHPGPARLSQFIRNDQILAQINQVPPGATAILVAGTNDSAGSVRGLEKNVDNIIRAVASRRIKLVWIGPPCVRKSWDKNARELDAMLATRLAATSIKYISIRSDAALCSGQYTGGDGVHLNFAGYTLMWNKARVAAGLPATEDRPVKVAATKRASRTHSAHGTHTVTDRPTHSTRMASVTDPRPQRRRNAAARVDVAPPSPFEGLFFWLRRN